MTNPSALLGLALGTLVSEDLTSISAGLLARDGVLPMVPAMAACAAGVYLGDLGLWLLGRVLGQRVLDMPWIAGRLDATTVRELGARIDTHLGLAVLSSRFLPGSRLPMYVAVGICGKRPLAFAAWSLVAVLLWTPLLVWLTMTFGAAVTAPLVGELSGVLRSLVSAAILLGVWSFAMRAISWRSAPSRS